MAENVKEYKHINEGESLKPMRHAIRSVLDGGTGRGAFLNAADLATNAVAGGRVPVAVTIATPGFPTGVSPAG